MSGPSGLDLHVHSRYSPDSRAPLEAILARASALGLRGIALTDHNSVAGHAPLAELAPRWPGLVLVPGVEVSTREGHLLVYGAHEAPAPGRPIEETIAWARAHDAVPVPAHPYRMFHGIGEAVAGRVAVPVLETSNGHNGSSANSRARALSDRRQLGGSGGSDAHRAEEVGRCVAEFHRPVDSVDEVLAELRAGRVTSSGRDLGGGERLSLALGTLGRRLARGLRPI